MISRFCAHAKSGGETIVGDIRPPLIEGIKKKDNDDTLSALTETNPYKLQKQMAAQPPATQSSAEASESKGGGS